MKHGKTKVKEIISSTFAFLLTLLFFTLFVSIGFGVGVFNSKSLISKINETDYYNRIYVELEKKAEEIVLQAGLPITVLKDVITPERVYAGGSNYINNTLKGENPQLDENKLRQDLTENINQYLTDQQVEQTEVIKSGTDKVVSRISQEYQSDVKLKFVNYYYDYHTGFWNLMKIFMPLVVVLIGVLCFFLLKMHKNKHRGLRYINYAMLSSGLLVTLISVSQLFNKGYDKLNVMPNYYRNFLSAYLKWDVMVFLYIGIIGLLLSVVLISLTGFLKNRSDNK